MRLLTAAIFIFFFSFHLSAQLTSNGAGGGDWDNPATWDGVNTPGFGDQVIIQDGDVITISEALIPGDKSASSVTINGTGNIDFTSNVAVNILTDLTMSGTSSITGTAGGQQVSMFGDFNIPSGTATLGGVSLVVSGTTNVDGTLAFASNIGNKTSGTVIIDGGTITYSNNEIFNVNILEMRDGASVTGSANGHRIDVTGDFNVTSGTATIGGNQINVSGTTTINGTLEFNNSVGNKTFTDVVIDGGTLAFSTNELCNITNNLEMRNGAAITGSASNHRVDIANEFNVTTGAASIGNHQLNANGTTTITGTLNIDGGTGTKNFVDVLIDGGTLNFNAAEFFNITNDLEMRNGASVTGTANSHRVDIVNAFNITAGTATVGGVQLNADGNTTVDGTLAFSSTTGNKTFNNITVSATGTFDNSTVTESFDFDGDLVNNGNWNGCSDGVSCLYDLNGTSNTISGTGVFNITDIRINNPGNYTNNGTIVLTDNLTGTGTFINGATGVLELRENGNYSLDVNGTLTLNTVGSIVRYAGGTNEIITLGPFYDLEVEMDNSSVVCQVNGSDVDVEGDLSVVEGWFRINSGNTLDVTGNVSIEEGSEILLNDVNALMNVGGNLTMSEGELDINDGDIAVTGDVSFTGGEMYKNHTDDLTPSSLTATNFSATNTYLLLSEGDVTLTGDMTLGTGSSLLMNQTSSELAITGDFDVSGTGNADFNRGEISFVNMDISGGGTVELGSSTFTSTGTMTVTEGTFTVDDGGAIPTFNNIVVAANGAFNGTATFDITVNGNLENNGTWNGCASSNCVYELTSGSGTITGSSTFNLSGFNIDNPASYTNSTTVSLTGDITGTGTLINSATGVLELTSNGDYSIHTDGTLTLNTVGSLVRYAGGVNEVIDIGPFYDLELDLDNATVICQVNGNDVSVEGDLTVIEGWLRVVGADNLDVAGDMLVEGGEFFLNDAAAVVSITGDLDVSSSVDLNNGTISFADMEVTSGGDVELSVTDFTSTGTVVVTNGLFTVDGAGTPVFNNISVGASGTWNVTAAYDPTINGNLHNIGSFTGCNGNGCDYTLTSNSGSITGSGAFDAMSNIILNDGASYTNTNTGGVNITNSLVTNSGTGTFINGANGSLIYGGTVGNFTVTNFTANAVSNTVTYNRTTTGQRIMATTDNTYHNLVIDKVDGVDMTTNEDLTFNGDITLNAGDIIMGNQDIILGVDANVIGGSTTGYIQQNGIGRVRKEYTTGGNSSTINIPFGDAATYAPMTFALVDSDAIPASAEIEFEYVAAAHPDRDNDNTGDNGDDDGTAATDYLNGYWNFNSSTVSNPTFNATLDYTHVGATGAEGNLQAFVLRTFTPDGGGSTIDWFGLGLKPEVGSGSINPTTNIVTYSNVIMGNTDNSDIGNTSNSVTLYAMDNSGDRLPITLIDFSAQTEGNQVKLDWSTASETNNDYFTIERSINGIDFKALLTKNGAGTSDGVIEYQAIDPFPISGRSYYRLKQTDFNGQFEYSKIVAVDFSGVEGVYDFYLIGNPVAGGESVDIQFSESLSNQPITIQMVGVNGRVYYQEDAVIDSALQMGLVAPRPSGMYVIQLITNQGRISKKLIVR